MSSGGRKRVVWARWGECIFPSGSLPTLQLCSERNRRLNEEKCADITVQCVIAIPCRPLKATLDCLSLINVDPVFFLEEERKKLIRACKKKSIIFFQKGKEIKQDLWKMRGEKSFYHSLVMKVCLPKHCSRLCRMWIQHDGISCYRSTQPLIAPCRAFCRPWTCCASPPPHTNFEGLHVPHRPPSPLSSLWCDGKRGHVCGAMGIVWGAGS